MESYSTIDSLDSLKQQSDGALVRLNGKVSNVALTGPVDRNTANQERTLSGLLRVGDDSIIFGGVYLKTEGSPFSNHPEVSLASIRSSSSEERIVTVHGTYKDNRVLASSIHYRGLVVRCRPELEEKKVPESYRLSTKK